MGTSTSVRQFSGKITKMATVTQTRQKQIVAEAALVVKELFYEAAAEDGIGPSSKIIGRPWGVRYDIKGFQNPTALVRVYGQFHLVERDTKPHYIVAKGIGGTRASRQGIAGSAALQRSLGGSPSGVFAAARKGKRRRGGRGGKQAMVYANARHPFTYAHHPGTTGKHSIARAKGRARVVVPRVMQKSLVSGWRQALR